MTPKKKAAPKRKPSRRPRATKPASDSPAALLGIPKSQVTYMLRTCGPDRRAAHNGFQWPDTGLVTCPDWSKVAECGHGLHGLLHGDGDNSLLNWNDDATWLVVAIDRSEIIEIERKIKVPRGVVVFCGSRSDATARLVALDPEAKSGHVPAGQASASGDLGQASASGYLGQASASGDLGQASASGYRGQASASGDRGQASASGDLGQASASGYLGQASASGDRGQASASGDRGQASASGDLGQASASGDLGQASARGRAKAGKSGVLLLFRWDAEAQRDRVVVCYVGENGIKENTWYKLDESGRPVESPADEMAYTADTIAATCAADARKLTT